MSTSTTPYIALERFSLHDMIVNHVRDMIIEGELAPGERIYEGPLCEKLGVSRTPLREALRYLASEGLVELTPQRGASVRKFSSKDIRDMMIVIRSLEELGARLACEEASDNEIKKIREMHDHMVALYNDENRLEYYKTNQKIHSVIMEMSHNEPLIQVHRTLQSKLKRARFLGLESKKEWSAALAEHHDMINALEHRDADEFSRILGEHIMKSWERIMDIFDI